MIKKRERERGRKRVHVIKASWRGALSSKALISHVFASKAGPECWEGNGDVSQQH